MSQFEYRSRLESLIAAVAPAYLRDALPVVSGESVNSVAERLERACENTVLYAAALLERTDEHLRERQKLQATGKGVSPLALGNSPKWPSPGAA
jgi:hypothetical protein